MLYQRKAIKKPDPDFSKSHLGLSQSMTFDDSGFSKFSLFWEQPEPDDILFDQILKQSESVICGQLVGYKVNDTAADKYVIWEKLPSSLDESATDKQPFGIVIFTPGVSLKQPDAIANGAVNLMIAKGGVVYCDSLFLSEVKRVKCLFDTTAAEIDKKAIYLLQKNTKITIKHRCSNKNLWRER